MREFSGYSWLLTALMLLAVTTQAFAASSPQEELQKTKKEMDAAQAHTKKLDAEAKTLAKKYSELTSQMVKTATALQASEAKLTAIEDKLQILTEQINEKTNSLAARKKELAVMVQAALKLSQTPKEAIILMPGDMANNMKASRALKMTTDNIKNEAQNIAAQMAELKQLKEKVTKSQEEATKEREQLEKQRALLKTQMAEHNALQQKLKAEQKEAKSRVQALAKKADDLKSLIIALEQEQQRERERQKQLMLQQQQGDEIKADNREPAGNRGSLRSFTAAKGNIRVPAAGKLFQKFGVESRNETSKGITIATRANAQVTAPYDAEVLFTGPFMEYGKVIILRHSGGFHTLLAGMAKIDVSVGDFLLEGEPIGAMGDKENNRLYMELRSNNQPVDPAGWIRGLNKG